MHGYEVNCPWVLAKLMWQLSISTLNRVCVCVCACPYYRCPSPFFVASILTFIRLSIIPCCLNSSNAHQNAVACTICFKQSVGSFSRCHNAHVTSSLSLKFNAFTEKPFRPLHFAPRFEMPPRRAAMHWLFWLGNFSYLYLSLYLRVSRTLFTTSVWLWANWAMREGAKQIQR